MAGHGSHSVGFKRQVAQAFLAGESLHDLAKRHDISRNLIRSNLYVRRVDKYEAGAFDDDAQAADLVQACAALERLVGEQALELEFSGRARRFGPQPGSAPMSVIAGPAASPSRKDAV